MLIQRDQINNEFLEWTWTHCCKNKVNKIVFLHNKVSHHEWTNVQNQKNLPNHQASNQEIYRRQGHKQSRGQQDGRQLNYLNLTTLSDRATQGRILSWS